MLEAYGDQFAAVGDLAAADTAWRDAAAGQWSFAVTATSGGQGLARMGEADRIDAGRRSWAAGHPRKQPPGTHAARQARSAWWLPAQCAQRENEWPARRLQPRARWTGGASLVRAEPGSRSAQFRSWVEEQMGRCRVLLTAVRVAALWGAGPLAAAGASTGNVLAARVALPAAGSWGKAIEVPGLGALNKQNAVVNEVSCASAGNCAAGGYYGYRSFRRQGFVAVERNGVWRRAIEVPGLGALNKQNAEVTWVSCGSAGRCAAVGDYGDGHGHLQGFVAVERHGRWRRAIEIPGLGALNKGKVNVWSVSCASAGSCAAGGDYEDRFGDPQGFVAVERHGRWGRAIRVPGLAALSHGGGGYVESVSCASAGNCAAGGDYFGRQASEQGFVAVERNGRWGRATVVPGLGALNKGGEAAVNSVSCISAGACAAGGEYEDRRGGKQGFVAVERNGRWGTAIEVPGLGALNVSIDGIGYAYVGSVSCASAGNCAAGGDYTDRQGLDQGFVAVERNGRWGTAIEVPGLGALSPGGSADVSEVSCASAGNCAAGGDYLDSDGTQGFVAVELNGRWGQAIGVPGLGALNMGGFAVVFSVSCAPAGTCAAAGYYTDRHDHSQGFVVSQTR